MREFNLIDEPWIPVVTRDGARVEVGIGDALRNGHSIDRIEHDSPLVVVSIYRLLLAVLYRALRGPVDFDAAVELLENGLPGQQIEGYLSQWHERFWLFDKRFPFWQVGEFQPKEWRSWAVLAAEHNPDNAKVLSNHTSVESAGEIHPGATARWICATQSFSVSTGKSELSHTGGAPSAGALMVIPLGASLSESLVFSLVPQNVHVLHGDLPVWERSVESIGELQAGAARAPVGFADLYTWRTRTIRCGREESGSIAKVAFASGVKPEPGQWIDAMVPYRIHETAGRLPLKLLERGVWRDFDSLLPDPANGLAPQIVEHATRLARATAGRAPRAFAVFGLANKKAKLERWQSAQFHWSQTLLEMQGVRAKVRFLLDKAEAGGRALRASTREFGRHVLARGDRRPHEADVTHFVDTLAPEPLYWGLMKESFHRALMALEAGARWDEVSARWNDQVTTAARESWRALAQRSSSQTAWSMRALLLGERTLNKELYRLKSGS
jgi:CRISPR system Cascade subunit CasA